jgi:hypothetical protein
MSICLSVHLFHSRSPSYQVLGLTDDALAQRVEDLYAYLARKTPEALAGSGDPRMSHSQSLKSSPFGGPMRTMSRGSGKDGSPPGSFLNSPFNSPLAPPRKSRQASNWRFEHFISSAAYCPLSSRYSHVLIAANQFEKHFIILGGI